MSAINQAVPFLSDVWPPVLAGVLALALWGVKKFVDWLTSNAGALRASPASARYWRARLAEGLTQLKDLPDGLERTQFVARVTDARVMVEAHEARRRVGFGDVASLWVIVGVFCVFGSIAGAVANEGALITSPWFLVPGALAICVEVLALHAASVRDEHVNALAAAGRYGHSDLVRDDPWLVLRRYDGWRSSARRAPRSQKHGADRRAPSKAWSGFERGLIGLKPRRAGLNVENDIWTREGVM